jgi:ABC-2 type transport system permease protein
MPSESVIHDIGYQRYDGPRLGRGYATRSLYSHGFRAAFGLGRSAKAKIFPWIVIGIVGAIALIFAVAKSQGAEVSYQDLPGVASVLLLTFVAVVAPELVSRDLRNHLLPLYFSRPLGRADYVFAKLGALVTAVWLLVAGPQTLIFAAGAFGGGDFWDEVRGLLRGYALTAVYAVVFACLALLIASVASRRAFAAGGIAAVFLVSLPVVAIVMALGNETVKQVAGVGSPMTLTEGIREWMFHSGDQEIGSYGPLYGAVGAGLCLLCVLLLLLRYRKVTL